MAGLHDRIIADAAKVKLAPLGFRRKDRSRTWVADHGWWLTVVEFQPSAWSKGCYLNVAAHWLWAVAGDVSLDCGGRIAEHVKYLTEAQFAPAAAQLAESAAIEAQRLARTFGSLSEAAEALLEAAQIKSRQKHLRPGWSEYDAGIAAALVGRANEAAKMFARILNSPAAPNSVLHPAAERMALLVVEPLGLREEVSSLIDRRREALRLPPLNAPPF